MDKAQVRERVRRARAEQRGTDMLTATECTHDVGVPCDNILARRAGDFAVADIDRLQSDYGYGGERRHMKSRQRDVDVAVVRAANRAGLSECLFREWLCSKLGRWFAEDSGWFFRRTREHNVTAHEIQQQAFLSMGWMRECIETGEWF